MFVSILHDDEVVRASLVLDADDYATAGLAHLHNQPVHFEGVLHRSVRTSRIEQVAGFARLERPVAATSA